MRRALSLFRAIVSVLRYGDLPWRAYLERQEQCVGCSHYERSLFGIYCGACSCPRWYVSDLRTKWRMPDAACPKGLWKR